jgi:heme-binding NEAT domain protein
MKNALLWMSRRFGGAHAVCCLVAWLMMTSTAHAQWWDVSWLEREKLTFKNGDQTENLTDFPVLVVLDSTRIDYSKTLNAGEDLRFIDSDHSTVLAHEIEEWNESGTSYVWVKVPQVDGSSTTDHIWMYYDYSSATDGQDARDVWTNGYEGVWHLNTDPSLGLPGTITFDSVTTNTSSSPRTSASFSHTVGTGDDPILIVVSTTRGDQGTSGVTYGGQALTLAVDADAGDGNREWVSIWYLVDPPTGSNTVAVSFNSNHDPTGVAVMSYFGVDQASPIDVTASKTTGSSATVSVDITPTVANAMIVGGLGHHGGDTDPHSPGTGVTERYDIVTGGDTDNDSGLAGGEIAATTAQQYTFEFTGAASDDFAIACVALKPAVAIADSHEVPWWDTDWRERSTLTFDNSGQTENLTDFPVLVKLDSGNIDYAKTQNAGQDLRFVDSDDTTELDFEIEEWNESGTSYVWVEVPQIDGSSSTDFIYMYYGNTGASDGQDVAGTWNSGYEAVLHLHDDFLDSTSHNNDGTNYGSTDAAAQFADGQDFDGSNDRVDTADISAIENSSYLTYTAWAKPSALADWRGVIAKSQNQSYRAGMHLSGGSLGGNNDVILTFGNGSATYGYTNANIISAGVWHHWAMVFDGTQTGNSNRLKFYLDGVEQTVTYSGTIPATSPNNTTPLQIASGEGSLYWDGVIDEARVASVARSADWIAAQYLSQTDALITYADAPPTSYDGVPGGAMTAADLVTGQISGALDFDGTNDRIEMGDVIDMGTSRHRHGHERHDLLGLDQADG